MIVFIELLTITVHRKPASVHKKQNLHFLTKYILAKTASFQKVNSNVWILGDSTCEVLFLSFLSLV